MYRSASYLRQATVGWRSGLKPPQVPLAFRETWVATQSFNNQRFLVTDTASANGTQRQTQHSQQEGRNARPSTRLGFALAASAAGLIGLGIGRLSQASQESEAHVYADRADWQRVSTIQFNHHESESLSDLNCVSPQALDAIRKALGEDAVSIEDDILKAHGYSDWSTINIDRLPVAVVYPSSTEDVSKIAKICHKYRVPMGKRLSAIPIFIANFTVLTRHCLSSAIFWRVQC